MPPRPVDEIEAVKILSELDQLKTRVGGLERANVDHGRRIRVLEELPPEMRPSPGRASLPEASESGQHRAMTQAEVTTALENRLRETARDQELARLREQIAEERADRAKIDAERAQDDARRHDWKKLLAGGALVLVTGLIVGLAKLALDAIRPPAPVPALERHGDRKRD